MLDKLDPRKQGAETPADIGVFLLGASVGGLADAALNVFGFAEPLVIAGLGGSGALGLKKMMWDAWRRKAASDAEAPALLAAPNPLGELQLEAVLLRKRDRIADADALDQAIVEGGKLGLSPEAVREVYRRTRTSGDGPAS